jgi:hypothetical protein
MGLDKEEFWWRILRFNWFGHQSRFDVPLPARVSFFFSSAMILLLSYPGRVECFVHE